MTYLMAGVMLCVAIWWVARPLLGSGSLVEVEPFPDVPLRVTALLADKEHLYRAIKDLEFDYHAGKVSEGDYGSMNQSLRHRAVEVIAALDKCTSGPAAEDDEIERAIAARRKGRGARIRDTGRASARKQKSCSQCGFGLSEADNFCSRCGSPKSEVL